MVTNQKTIIDAQKIKRKESNHNTKEKNQIMKEENKRKEQRETTKTTRKQ